ncbi:hypothetical protein SDC9_134170 [bioreactor metagenome]|uniref:Uncharacterized protein n=1 Tax=bioreactor metagenome TaxID=1076179 RepID=A0A645DCX2_9ZZZZ
MIEGLFTFIVTSTQPGATLATNCINFIYENDTWAVSFGLVKQVTYAAGTDTDEHFYKFGARDREERHASFSRDCFGKQGFTGTRRADQEYTLRNASTQSNEFLRFSQELYHFF